MLINMCGWDEKQFRICVGSLYNETGDRNLNILTNITKLVREANEAGIQTEVLLAKPESFLIHKPAPISLSLNLLLMPQ